MSWFASWFDSPYYHTLYKHRDDREAEKFIDHLYQYFDISTSQNILDVACGKGRHALYMAKKGNQTTGIDLSPNSIAWAQKMATENHLEGHATFLVQDMRAFALSQKFDFIFNLFTSLGYFDTKEENLELISCIANHQKENGYVVIDYLNSKLVIAQGESKEIKQIDEIEFQIHKLIEKNHVYKYITVVDHDTILEFQERVQLFEPNEIEGMLIQNGYEIIAHCGDYQLQPYREEAPRSIIIGHKK